MIRLSLETRDRLAQALKERRQLTFAEQLDATNLLNAVRVEALRYFGRDFPDKERLKEDPPDVVMLKRHGLLEVARFSQDRDASSDDGKTQLADDLRGLFLGLAEEAAHGYVSRAGHKVAQVTEHAKADRDLAEKKKREDLNARLEALEAARPSSEGGLTVGAGTALNARLDDFEVRLMALEEQAQSTTDARFVSLAEVRRMFDPFQRLLDGADSDTTVNPDGPKKGPG